MKNMCLTFQASCATPHYEGSLHISPMQEYRTHVAEEDQNDQMGVME